MSEQRNVKVFISWSGDLAKEVAVALREWLPLLFDRVEPWASDTDIAAGQRGLGQIEAELRDTQFGIVVVTSSNQHAPWLNFEAGALSKTIPGDVEQRVVPLLVDLSGPSQLTGPLVQFQAKVADRDGALSLLRSLAAVAGIEERVVAERFEAYWPKLEAKIGAAKAAATQGQPSQPRRGQADVLDEILLHVRALRSEGEAGGPRARKGEGRAAFREWLDVLAGEHRLEIFQYSRGDDGAPEIMVSPRGKFSEADIEAFEQALRRQVSFDVRVYSIPF